MAKVTFTYGEMTNILGSMHVKELLDAKPPVTVSFALKKIVKALAEEVKLLDEKRMELLDEYAEKDESGNLKFVSPNSVQLKEGMVQEYNEKLNEAMSVAVEVDIPTISVTSLVKVNKDGEKYEMEVHPNVFSVLEKVFVD